MGIEAVLEAGRKNHYNRSRNIMKAPTRVKQLLAVILVGMVCLGSYHLGTNFSDSGELERKYREIQHSVEQFRAVKRNVKKLDTEGQVHSVVKRDARGSDEDFVFKVTDRTGATYTRWGRRDCPDVEGTTLVYEGVAAGSYYNYNGGGSNLLCLHLDVTYTEGNYVDGNQGSSYIYGVEFKDAAWADKLFNLSLIEAGNFRYFAVPCAVCMTRSRINQLMIPGRDSCPAGWKKEYTGYIFSSAHTSVHSSSYVCIDDTPQVVPGSDGSQGGEYIYIVETQCPSLQCEPYVSGREIRCVVCTI